jgi:carbon monoxide dehydrogenase subunit G
MIIEQRVTVAAPAARVWEVVIDVPAVSRCVPGVDSVEKIDDDTYSGTMKIKVGPISLNLQGRITIVERDRENWQARMELKAADRRISGSVGAKMTMRLEPRDDQTDLAIHTDAAIMGKLGEFGQAVMRKKADQIVAEFARNLSAQMQAAAR